MSRLVINNRDQLYNEEFITFLIKMIQIDGQRYINDEICSKFDEFFHSNIERNNRKLLTKNIILSGLYNIVYKKYNNYYIISINDNIKVPYYNNLKLYNLCELIDKGNLMISGTDIFQKIFKTAKRRLKIYYNLYQNIQVRTK